MRTLVVVTALVVSSIVTGCAPGAGPEPAARDASSARYTLREVPIARPEIRANSERSTRALVPLTRRETLRNR
jgi:hypothetical protein